MGHELKSPDELKVAENASRPTQTYKGSCHCGTVFYNITVPSFTDPTPRELVTCNCTNCSQRGLVLTHSQRVHLKITRGADQLQGYKYSTGEYPVRWCGNCGVVIGYLKSVEGEPTGGEMFSINARTLHDVDYEALPKKKINQLAFGKPWERPTE